MKESMSLRQLVTTPISVRDNSNVEQRRRAAKVYERQQRSLHKLQLRRTQLTRRLEGLVRRNRFDAIEETVEALRRLCDQERLLQTLDPQSNGTSRYVVVFSSWMLVQSFAICNALPEEGMHLVAGIEFDGVTIATQILEFPYQYRSVAGAAGDHQATHRLMIESHERDHRVVAMIHSHPGSGINANRRSSTDERTQQLWERTTSLIGGIWSRDGFLRWYTSALPYEVKVVGSGIEQIDSDLWKLQLE